MGTGFVDWLYVETNGSGKLVEIDVGLKCSVKAFVMNDNSVWELKRKPVFFHLLVLCI